MTNIKITSLSDSELLQTIESLARREREIQLELIHHLLECERRLLHIERGYSDIIDYLIRGLKYSKGAAYRRRDAMHAVRDVPEVEQAILDGRVNLTTVTEVQSFLKREERIDQNYSQAEKRELFQAIEGKSKEDTQKMLLAISPQSVRREIRQPVAPGETEIRFIADEKLLEMLDRLKGLLSHQLKDQTYAELIRKLSEMALKKLDPHQKQHKKSAADQNPKTRIARGAVKTEVQKRDESCTYVDPLSGRRCQSKYFPQIDHEESYYRGGLTTPVNLRVLCSAHHRLVTRQEFGYQEEFGRQ